MAVDCKGQLAVLAGYDILDIWYVLMLSNVLLCIWLYRRKQLAIIDLNQPMMCLKKHSRQSKWEVGTAEWSPNFEKRHMFAITVSVDISNSLKKYHKLMTSN